MEYDGYRCVKWYKEESRHVTNVNYFIILYRYVYGRFLRIDRLATNWTYGRNFNYISPQNQQIIREIVSPYYKDINAFGTEFYLIYTKIQSCINNVINNFIKRIIW